MSETIKKTWSKMPNQLVWIDMEMSGLDPNKERILEIAVILTDSDLNVIAEGPEIVVKQDKALLDAMDAWNTEHHGKSGLIEKVLASTVDTADAEAQVLAFLETHCKKNTVPLAGNSVYQDRRFLERYMPQLDDFLHYRIVDVSSIKELCRRWYPGMYRTRPDKKLSHRAMDDIKESIAELAYYRQTMFL